MEITHVSISRDYQTRKFKAEVSINSDYGAVKLQLPDEYVARLIPVVADLLVAASQDVAKNLTKQALDHKALEHIV